MEIERIKGIIESILFASGRVVSLQEFEVSLELEQGIILDALSKMQEEYKKQSRGIEIVRINDGYTMASKKEYHEYIYSIIDKRAKPNLSQAALEVLAIIAYNPKITRAEIDNIRGVSSDASIYRLLEHNMITEAGKLELPGKPMSYKVTEEFLKKFGINSLEDLPDLPRYKMDDNRQIVIEDILLENEKQNMSNDENKKENTETFIKEEGI